jgi:maltooligosyltrehalose trehalohydrolase
MDVFSSEEEQILLVRRWTGSNEVMIIFNFNSEPQELCGRMPSGTWHCLLNSAEPQWNGPGSKVPERLVASPSTRMVVGGASVVSFEKESEV